MRIESTGLRYGVAHSTLKQVEVGYHVMVRHIQLATHDNEQGTTCNE